MNKEIIRSPINYSGSKFKLLPQILPLFPKDIDCFYDIFGGSGSVSLNCDARQIYFNDIIPYVGLILSGVKNYGVDKTLEEMNLLINKYSLSKTNEEGFKKLREDYNNDKSNWLMLFVLTYYSFNFQMRFNNSGEYNSSFGKNCSHFGDKAKDKVVKAIERLQDIDFKHSCKDFMEFDYSQIEENDFVYLDPPYSVSCAVYQDGKRGFKGWSKNDDKDLMNLCDKLNERNIKFAMSNMIESKDNINEELIEWSKKYNVYYLNRKYSNCNYQRDTEAKDVEVLITNY